MYSPHAEGRFCSILRHIQTEDQDLKWKKLVAINRMKKRLPNGFEIKLFCLEGEIKIPASGGCKWHISSDHSGGFWRLRLCCISCMESLWTELMSEFSTKINCTCWCVHDCLLDSKGFDETSYEAKEPDTDNQAGLQTRTGVWTSRVSEMIKRRVWGSGRGVKPQG